MPNQFGPFGGAQIDFSGLADLPDSFERGAAFSRQRQLRSAMAGVDPNDFQTQAKILMQFDPELGTRFARAMAEQQATAAYRKEALKPNEQRLYESLYGPGAWTGGQPPQGTQPPPPAANSEAPSAAIPSPQQFLQSRQAVKDPYTIQSEKERAKYNAYTSRKQAQAPNLKAGLRTLKKYVDDIDDASFENALGPLQGAEPGNIVTQTLAQVPRVGGEIANYFEGGAVAPTEVRNQIGGAAQALSAAIKPLVRAPGEGIWTDKDQELLDRIVGNLAESRTKAEFNSRLAGVANRVQANFGIDLSGWDAKEGSPAATEAGIPRGWGSAGVAGPGNESPYSEAGPQPSPEHMLKLRKYADDPEFRATFEGIYGAGSVDRWLNNEGWTGR